MRADELMIGDIVFHEKYGNAIIETIDNDFGDNPSVKLISENIKHKDGYKYGYCWCDLDEIFPIPLTPEILEKNGFVEINDDKKWYKIQLFEKYDFVGLEELEDNYWMFGAVVFPNLINHLSIKYVHELQNELKLLKVEKEIVL
jgi:hypothetical protein